MASHKNKWINKFKKKEKNLASIEISIKIHRVDFISSGMKNSFALLFFFPISRTEKLGETCTHAILDISRASDTFLFYLAHTLQHPLQREFPNSKLTRSTCSYGPDESCKVPREKHKTFHICICFMHTRIILYIKSLTYNVRQPPFEFISLWTSASRWFSGWDATLDNATTPAATRLWNDIYRAVARQVSARKKNCVSRKTLLWKKENLSGSTTPNRENWFIRKLPRSINAFRASPSNRAREFRESPRDTSRPCENIWWKWVITPGQLKFNLSCSISWLESTGKLGRPLSNMYHISGHFVDDVNSFTACTRWYRVELGNVGRERNK